MIPRPILRIAIVFNFLHHRTWYYFNSYFRSVKKVELEFFSLYWLSFLKADAIQLNWFEVTRPVLGPIRSVFFCYGVFYRLQYNYAVKSLNRSLWVTFFVELPYLTVWMPWGIISDALSLVTRLLPVQTFFRKWKASEWGYSGLDVNSAKRHTTFNFASSYCCEYQYHIGNMTSMMPFFQEKPPHLNVLTRYLIISIQATQAKR